MCYAVKCRVGTGFGGAVCVGTLPSCRDLRPLCPFLRRPCTCHPPCTVASVTTAGACFPSCSTYRGGTRAVLTSSAPGALACDGSPPLRPPSYTLWTVAAGRGGSRGEARSGRSSLLRAFILACSRYVESSWLVSRNCSSPTCCVCLFKVVLLSSACQL